MQMPRTLVGLPIALAYFTLVPGVQATSPATADVVADSNQVVPAFGFAEDTAEQPYTNSIVSAEDTLPIWSLELSFTGSHSPDSSLQRTWTNEATRSWHRGDWEPSVVAGWSHSDQGQADSTLWHLGTGIDWNFSKIFALGAAVDWAWVPNDKDDASARLGISGSDRFRDRHEVDGAISGTWDRIHRGDLQASLGISPDFIWTDGRIGVTWDRLYQSYQDASGSPRSEYLNVWGWSAQWAFHFGKWSTGPTWSGDYWKANASTSMASTGKAGRLLGRTRKVPASGKAIDQEFLWNLTWKPLTGIAFSLDAFHSTGGETIHSRAGATPLEKTTLARWTQATALPQDATGGRGTISVAW